MSSEDIMKKETRKQKIIPCYGSKECAMPWCRCVAFPGELLCGHCRVYNSSLFFHIGVNKDYENKTT